VDDRFPSLLERFDDVTVGHGVMMRVDSPRVKGYLPVNIGGYMTKMLRWTEEQLTQYRGEQKEFRERLAVNNAELAKDPHLKYNNRPTGGYHSRKEHDHAMSLRLMAKCGDISELKEQVCFVLIPTQHNADGTCGEREVRYYADFTFKDRAGKLHVQDVKSEATRTAEYVIKRKLMRHIHGIVIEEI
jgi:hypothetical protein